MQFSFENYGQKENKQHYISAFVSFLMPMVWIFLPQIFSPLERIESYIFGGKLLGSEQYTLDDYALLAYFGIGIVIGIIGIIPPNKSIATIIFAIIGMLINFFLLFGMFIAFGLRDRVPV